MNYMEFYRRINKQYNRGVSDGLRGKRKPGLTYGSFRAAYERGNLTGQRLHSLRKKETGS